MTKVFFNVTMSLDGSIAPKLMQLGQPLDQWLPQWMELQRYVFQQRFFRENLKLGDGGETGEDNRILEETFNRTGASIMGKRMFDGGEQAFPHRLAAAEGAGGRQHQAQWSGQRTRQEVYHDQSPLQLDAELRARAQKRAMQQLEALEFNVTLSPKPQAA